MCVYIKLYNISYIKYYIQSPCITKYFSSISTPYSIMSPQYFYGHHHGLNYKGSSAVTAWPHGGKTEAETETETETEAKIRKPKNNEKITLTYETPLIIHISQLNVLVCFRRGAF